MLLLPNKNAHPDITILAVSSHLLRILQKSGSENYVSLYEKINSIEPRAASLFRPGLNFLFVLGLIDYHQKNDLIEYIGK
ncbi:hypothetical protein EKG40_18965 [Pseudomonas moorei]|nr:hypothetical protein EKG40_18965 [Pseudomonas moorei]